MEVKRIYIVSEPDNNNIVRVYETTSGLYFMDKASSMTFGLTQISKEDLEYLQSLPL